MDPRARVSPMTANSSDVGWRPERVSHRALRNTVKWYQDNPGWLKSRKTKEFEEYFDRQYGSL